MTATQKITVTRYAITGTTYEVGSRLKLTKALTQRLKTLAAASKKADRLLMDVYTALIRSENDDEHVVDKYFIDYQSAAAHKAYLLGEFNRALLTHFGAFVPVQINLSDEPFVTVRAFEQNEPHEYTIAQVAQATNWTAVGVPALHVLQRITNTDTSNVTTDFDAWQALSSMTFATEARLSAIPTLDETAQSSQLIQDIVTVLSDPSVTQIPYIIITEGPAGTIAVSAKPDQMLSPEFATYLYTNALGMVKASRDQGFFAINIFAETVRGDDNTLDTIVSIMLHTAAGDASTSCALRYKKDPTGALVFSAFWDSEAIRRNVAEMAKK